MSELMPKLESREVAPEKLIPDPNNPRLISSDGEHVDEKLALELLDRTFSIMRSGSVGDSKKDDYKIKEIERSILNNGWVPVDYIFVKKFGDDGYYLVLEGNRRITAIRNLRNYEEVEQETKDKLKQIEVMEIVGEEDEEILKKKITYLLGVRHHGSLKKWTPFAQAHNIYLRYLKVSNQDKESFKWCKEEGQKVAESLSIEVKEVEGRLRVYRVMDQLDCHELMQDVEGKIEARYYSVISEVTPANDKALKKYIEQNSESFDLSEESVSKIINLCRFDVPGRKDSPINNPQEWRKFATILNDPEDARRAEMISEVENEGKKPSEVYAQRASELQRISWETWLSKVNNIVSKINVGQLDINNEEAMTITRKISVLIEMLEQKDVP